MKSGLSPSEDSKEKERNEQVHNAGLSVEVQQRRVLDVTVDTCCFLAVICKRCFTDEKNKQRRF